MSAPRRHWELCQGCSTWGAWTDDSGKVEPHPGRGGRTCRGPVPMLDHTIGGDFGGYCGKCRVNEQVAIFDARFLAAEALVALERALPLLIRLGDFVGNDDGRCEAILAVRGAIERLKGGA